VHIRPAWSIPAVLISGLALAVPLTTAQAATTATDAALITQNTAGPVLSPAVRAATKSTTGTVTLPTGDRVQVLVKPDGSSSVVTRPAVSSGPGRILISQTRGGDRYVLPAVAEPYLGNRLDPALFDVTRLIKAKKASGRLGVTFSYTGSKPSAPGVKVTSAKGGTAHGFLTAKSSKTFGQALAAQWVKDSAAGWPKRSTLFDGVTKISADLPAVAPAAIKPNYPLYTLIVKVLGPDGLPQPEGEVGLVNVDDSSKAVTYLYVVDGEARVSVPKGHYSAISDDYRLDAGTEAEHYRITTLSDFNFTATGQTVTLDHRTATIAPQVSTPKPANQDGYTFELYRSDDEGFDGLDYGLAINGPLDFRYAPAKAATHGQLFTLQGWHLASEAGDYTYDLATSTPDVPSTPVFTFADKDLATVTSKYYNDGGAHDSLFIRTATYPVGLNTGIYTPVKLGTTRTEYVGATGKPTWYDELVIEQNNPDDFGLVDVLDRTIPAGAAQSASWLRGPIGAGVAKQTGLGFCLTCRTSKQMLVALSTVTDSNAYHTGDVFPSSDGVPVTRFRFYQNGKKIYDQDDSTGDVFAVPTGKATYRALLDVDRRQLSPLQSTVSKTELTFSSAKGKGAKLPGSWFCFLAKTCNVLPIVQAKLGLPTDLNGRLPVGKSTVTVTVAPIQKAAASAATSATLQIRPANHDWSTVKLTSIGGGVYTGTINNTAALAGLNVDVRFSGADKAGSTFKQTVVRAYTVAGS
jgi:hypothetical protein